MDIQLYLIKHMFLLCSTDECGHPRKLLQSGVSVHGTTKNSVITFSCEPGYSLHGNTTSQCVSGEWTPSPQTVMCIADQDMVTPTTSEREKKLLAVLLKRVL